MYVQIHAKRRSETLHYIEMCVLCVWLEEGDTCAHEVNENAIAQTDTNTHTHILVAVKPHNIKLMATQPAKQDRTKSRETTNSTK